LSRHLKLVTLQNAALQFRQATTICVRDYDFYLRKVSS